MEETTQEEEFDIREPDQNESLKKEIEYYQALSYFASTEVGKQLIEERERQIVANINKLFRQLSDPNLTQILSIIVQLKSAMRDLVDFKGSTDSLNIRKDILDSLTKKKDE